MFDLFKQTLASNKVVQDITNVNDDNNVTENFKRKITIGKYLIKEKIK